MTSHRFSLRNIAITLIAAVAVVVSALAYLYQKASAQLSVRDTSGGLQAINSCTNPDESTASNDRKQLYVGCAGFLD